MSRLTERDPDPFAADVARIGGYAYTTNARLSSWLANKRLTEATLKAINITQRRVLDIGCGDGEYTVGLQSERSVSAMCGIDINVAALAVALRKNHSRAVSFVAATADALPFRDGSFEIGQLRGVLHHLDDPAGVLREAFRVCSAVVTLEPNGYNPILKVLERCSPYHRAHEEKSYLPLQLDRWIAAAGGRTTVRFWAGLVPMFCPDWLARLTKRFEPAVERIPILNRIACAVYVVTASRNRAE